MLVWRGLLIEDREDAIRRLEGTVALSDRPTQPRPPARPEATQQAFEMPGLLWFSPAPEGSVFPLWCEARTPFALMQQCLPSSKWITRSSLRCRQNPRGPRT